MNARIVGRFITSVATLLTVAVGLPVGLMAASTARFGSANPLEGVRAPWTWGWSGVTAALSGPLADDAVIDAIVRASLCTVWVAAALAVVTTLAEFIHAIRHRGLPLPEIRGLGWAQLIGRYIAVGLVTVLPVMAPATSLASTLDARPSASSAAASPGDPSHWVTSSSTAASTLSTDDQTSVDGHGVVPDQAARSTAAPNMRAGTRLVAAGESIYSIAVDMAGADTGRVIEIADAIIEANLGGLMPSGQRFTSPAYIETGWTLTIPASIRPAGSTQTPPDRVVPTHIDLPSDAHDDTVYVVAPGDTLWAIAGEQLGDPMAWPEIWDRNAGAPMGDGRSFDDPNLILPGWKLELHEDKRVLRPAEPPMSDAVAEPDPATQSETDGEGDPSSRWSDESIATATTTIATAPANEMPSQPASASTTPGTAGVAATDTTPGTTTPPTDGRNAGFDGLTTTAPGPTSPAPIRLEHAALLAAGVLALVGVRRRQRLRAAMPRHRVPEPHPDVAETERRLRRIGAGERALRLDVACRAAAWSLIGTGCQIGWASASPDGTIELRLTDVASLPAPWVGVDQNWRLSAEVPVELLSESARQVGQPCVALVPLGVTQDGSEVVVDLEAAGQLAIAAPAEHADEIVTAIAASLASSAFAEIAHLIGVSISSSAMLGHRNAHLTESSDAALDLATALTGTTTSNERTTFELRSLRTGGEMWEPAVVLLRGVDGNDSDAEVSDIRPGHGLAVVIADEQERFGAVGARLVAEPDGWRLDAFGTSISLTPIGVCEHDLTRLADLVADASRELVEHDDPVAALSGAESTSASEHVAATPERCLGPEDSASDPDSLAGAAPTDEVEPTEPFEPLPHEIVVGLLGAVEVRDRNGVAGNFERSKTVELIAWLATHRDRATRSGARTALWEMDVRDATFANVVSEARRKLARLVMPPDGEEWVGRTLTEQLPLHQLVVTDADLVEERLVHARLQPPSQAVETLRPAVELVRDMPFAGTGYLWPDAEGLTSNLVMLAITATAEFAAHALSLGDIEGVFWSTGHGLRVLSGHEELIALRMQAHARSGDLAGVRQEWESYERVLVADAWSDGEPAPRLLTLRRELLDHTSP